MGRLIYAMNVSLDGFVETPDHGLEWANVDEEVHGWFNDGAREIEASIYGRRMYELMAAYWPTAEDDPDAKPVEREYSRIWKSIPKVVFSITLTEVSHNSRLVRGDVGEVLSGLRNEFSGDMDLGGARMARQFIERGLVDEYRLVVHPVAIGAGTPFFPPLDRLLRLHLVETKRFEAGVVALTYVPT